MFDGIKYGSHATTPLNRRSDCTRLASFSRTMCLYVSLYHLVYFIAFSVAHFTRIRKI